MHSAPPNTSQNQKKTWKGHGRKIKSGLRSTRINIEAEEKAFPPTEVTDSVTSAKAYNLQDDAERRLYSDQTGKFPVTSFKGHQYIIVLYELSSRNILVEPMRNRTAAQMVCAYQKMIDRLANGGIKPTLHILDNECSHEYKVAIEGNDMKYQLVPPHDHRRNVAEKAIQTFKDHFLSVLCGADINFPLRL